MKFKQSFLLLFLTVSVIFPNSPDSSLYKWESDLVAELGLSQIAFSNWAKGGESSFSFKIKLDWETNYKSQNWSFNNKFVAVAGRSKINPGILKTTANEMYNVTVFRFKTTSTSFQSPFISFLIRTPITEGYDYKVTPEKVISGFFDPGYLTQTFGMYYSRADVFKTRIGVAFEESFANKFASRYTDDKETENSIEYFKYETGIESVSDLKLPLDKDIMYKSTLRLFSGFERLKVWDVLWNNNLTAKFNSWFNVHMNFILIYNTKESLQTQIQEAIEIGFVYNFF